MLEHLEVLASLTGISKTELEAKLKENASEDGALNKDTVSNVLKESFSTKFKSVSESQYNRGLREKGEEIERFVKDNYELTGAKGTDLIKELVSTREQAIRDEKGGEGDKITKETASSHPIVVELLQERTNALKSKFDTEIEGYKTTIAESKERELKRTVYGKAQSFLLASKAIITDSEGKVDSKKWKTLKILLDQENFKMDENGDPVPVDAKGNRLEDANFNKVSFEDHVKSLNPFGFHEFDPKHSGAGGQTGGGAGGGKNRFKNVEEYRAFIKDRSKTKEEIKAAQQDWKQQQQNNNS